jgi:hypothetical protein
MPVSCGFLRRDFVDPFSMRLAVTAIATMLVIWRVFQ